MYKSNYVKFLCIGLLSISISCSSDDNSVIEKTNELRPDDQIESLIQPTSFYLVNEGWFGHENGSINGIDSDLNINYRIFENTNPGLELGLTTQFATAYGQHYFAVSKMENRLVMMDKKFKSQAILTDIGGDGRSFTGINENKAYISTSKGITVLDISANQIRVVKTISGYTKEVGTLIYRNHHVYAATMDGLLIIDSQTDEIVANTKERVHQLTIDRQGNIWAGTANTLRKYDTSLAVDQQIAAAISYDTSTAPIPSSAGAWNAGSLSSSSKNDVLYWTSGKNVVSFDITTANINNSFYTLGMDADDVKLSFYGAGLRVDPVSDDLVLMVKRENYGINGSYNWAQIVSNTGIKKKEVFIAGGTQNPSNGHYWFPAIPLFQDNNAPQITLNQIGLKLGETKTIELENSIIDQDNPQKLIEITVENVDPTFASIALVAGKLQIKALQKAGKSTFTIKANSNGKITNKSIDLIVVL